MITLQEDGEDPDLDDNVINIMKVEKIWNNLGHKSGVSSSYVQLCCLHACSHCPLCKSMSLHTVCA